MSLRGGIGLPELPIEDGQEFRLGIMGGTFDPIHYGHLVTAEQARESLDLDAVLFMPAGSPAFKLDKPVTPAEDRYAMTVLATAANPAFLASRFEIDRAGITYTADTLRALRPDAGQPPESVDQSLYCAVISKCHGYSSLFVLIIHPSASWQAGCSWGSSDHLPRIARLF